jgi:CRP-like cAMP-binding protein
MESKALDLGLLRSFSPLDGLKSENLQSLARKTVLRELLSGRLLFKEGESDKRTYYLVNGVIELLQDHRTVSILRGGSPEARNPIAPFTPRRYSVRAVSERAEFIAIDSEMLDMMLTWDQTGSYEVTELTSFGDEAASSDDWMTTLLQTKAFHRIPPANIQAIFMRMQRVDAKAGDVIIKQGDEGDYFYVIVKGRCAVTRETPLNKAGIKLAELGMGDTFGEEALIADAKRNANITMLTDGALMRLAKDDFRKLLNEPMLNWVSMDQAKRIIDAGGRWLDVRIPSEFENTHMEDALNVPLYFIRLKLKTLDPKIHYVAYCDTGRRSSAAAYILAERGLNASVLRGGLNGTTAAPKS